MLFIQSLLLLLFENIDYFESFFYFWAEHSEKLLKRHDFMTLMLTEKSTTGTYHFLTLKTYKLGFFIMQKTHVEVRHT